MNAIVRCVAVAIFAVAIPAVAEEPTSETRPCNIDRLDKAWNLKFKLLTVKNATAPDNMPVKEVRVTLKCEKDVADPRSLRIAFEVPDPKAAPKGVAPVRVLFYVFDEEDVILGKWPVAIQEGEITGIGGDAFRAAAQIDPTAFAKAKKIELRLSEPLK